MSSSSSGLGFFSSLRSSSGSGAMEGLRVFFPVKPNMFQNKEAIFLWSLLFPPPACLVSVYIIRNISIKHSLIFISKKHLPINDVWPFLFPVKRHDSKRNHTSLLINITDFYGGQRWNLRFIAPKLQIPPFPYHSASPSGLHEFTYSYNNTPCRLLPILTFLNDMSFFLD